MGTDLRGAGGGFRFHELVWSKTLQMAEMHGWNPPRPEPLPQWLPGQPRPADWPSHIHVPREVVDRAKENGIDWRNLLESPDAACANAHVLRVGGPQR